jgi:signal transduction histidine kinase
MSHEIRTPINAVLGYADLLDLGLDGQLSEPQHERVARIRASGRHLLGLVDELLDLAKIEAEQLRVERVKASAAEAAATALALVYPQATARGLSVDARCAAGADAAYMGDPHRVEQVLTNLLANAVKFTPEGGRIDVSCGLTDAPSPDARLAEGPDAAGAGTRCWCFVRVADTGPGVAPEMAAAVFEPFVQAALPAPGADQGPGTAASTAASTAAAATASKTAGQPGAVNPYTRTHGGTGLGLAISRRLARLMGGDVTLESTPGAGATFTLWLPAPPSVRATATGQPAGCTTDDRRTGLRHVAGLARAGEALRERIPAVLASATRRLRAELPGARAAAVPPCRARGPPRHAARRGRAVARPHRGGRRRDHPIAARRDRDPARPGRAARRPARRARVERGRPQARGHDRPRGGRACPARRADGRRGRERTPRRRSGR